MGGEAVSLIQKKIEVVSLEKKDRGGFISSFKIEVLSFQR